MLSTTTIVAPITASGEAAVGIVRLSGSSSVSILDSVFSGRKQTKDMLSHHFYRGRLQDATGCMVDDVMVVIMRAPRSYTGEDVVEIHCHGGNQIMRRILDLFLGCGAQMAAPGEFTQRAFLNGRLDLAQAEAVIEVIRARSDQACRIALDQLDGCLSREVYRFTENLKACLALLEAHIDFPDDEVGALSPDSLLSPVSSVCAEMKDLLDSFDTGRALREGINVLILGRPNVGKSSLLNALLGEARAIVTEIAGTTRDTLEENLVLGGYPLRLIDAAGVRETDDPVEREGVKRARDKVASSDLVLMVLDGSVELTQEDHFALTLCDKARTVLVLNKSDQAQVVDLQALREFSSPVAVSAKHGIGLDLLQQSMLACLDSGCNNVSTEGVVITERRHRDALLQAVAALERFLAAIASADPLECLALELREGLSALGGITGETTPDEILDQIFGQFCIGK